MRLEIIFLTQGNLKNVKTFLPDMASNDLGGRQTIKTNGKVGQYLHLTRFLAQLVHRGHL